MISSQEPTKTTYDSSNGPVGIGGWLVLPIIGFGAVFVLTAINLLAAVGQAEGLRVIFSPDAGELAQLRLPVALSILFGVAILISAAVCLYKIVVSKTSLRMFAVAHYVILVVGSLIELWADRVIGSAIPSTTPDPEVTRGTVQAFIAALVWIPYFLISKRVKNTFEKKEVIDAPR